MSPVPSYKQDDDVDVDVEESYCKKINSKAKDSPESKYQSSITSSFNVTFTRVTHQSSLDQNSDENQDLCEGSSNDDEVKNGSAEDLNEAYKDINYDIIGDVTIHTNLSLISQFDLSACGIPLQIFTEVGGHLNVMC